MTRILDIQFWFWGFVWFSNALDQINCCEHLIFVKNYWIHLRLQLFQFNYLCDFDKPSKFLRSIELLREKKFATKNVIDCKDKFVGIVNFNVEYNLCTVSLILSKKEIVKLPWFTWNIVHLKSEL